MGYLYVVVSFDLVSVDGFPILIMSPDLSSIGNFIATGLP